VIDCRGHRTANFCLDPHLGPCLSRSMWSAYQAHIRPVRFWSAPPDDVHVSELDPRLHVTVRAPLASHISRYSFSAEKTSMVQFCFLKARTVVIVDALR
jgi:hypothetical protein